jgi:hypothetical protein
LADSKSKFAIIPLIVLVGIEGFLYVQLQVRYNALQSEYSVIHDQYEDLEDTYGLLLAEYQSLQSNYNSLNQSHVSLETDYEIESILRIGNSLECYYDLLRKEKGPTRLWSKQQEADFAAYLALHDLGRYYWPSLENEYYEDVGENSYETAKRKIDAIIELTGALAYSSPVEKIERILEFIRQNIHYEYDMEDIFLAPVETLGLKSGDCDDFSILAAALFEAAGIDAAFGIFKNETTEKKYHCMVLVHLENLGGYGYWSYSDLTHRGLAAGKWMVIEPQYTIDRQRDDWIGQWSLIAASPLELLH